MDPSAQQAVIDYLKHDRHYINYGFTVALTLALYDWLLNINDEIFLLWLSPWSYTKGLFVLVRYLPIFSLGMDIPNVLIMGMKPSYCSWSFPMAMWLLMFGVFLAEIVLIIRTWAIYHRNKIVGCGLVVLLLCSGGAATYSGIVYQKTLTFSPPLYPGFRGCVVKTASTVLGVGFLVLAGVDIVVFLLIAMSAFGAYRTGSTNELITVIHRDGMLFYVYLLAASVVNVTVMNTLPIQNQQMLTTICCALYSVLTTRIVLDIRRAARKTHYSLTELHEFKETTMEFRTGSGGDWAAASVQSVD